jgi:hypothetical protein
MYQNVGLSVGGVTTGVVGVALLPKTSGFRFMFVFSVIALVIGGIVLISSALIAIKKQVSKK